MGQNSQQSALAHETFDIVEGVLNDITKDGMGWMGEDSKLILLGGLMINIDGSDQDYFEPLTFTVGTKGNTKADNVLPKINNFVASGTHAMTKALKDPLFEHASTSLNWKGKLTKL